MPRSLQSPVWKCVAEDRAPFPIELNSLATKIMREAFGCDESSANQYRAEVLAHLALEGDRTKF